MSRVQLPLVERRIEEWKQKLIDLTRRNRLLYLRLAKRSSLVISQPNSDQIFSRLLVQEKTWKFWLPPIEIEDDEGLQQATKKKEPSREPIPKQDELVCDKVKRKDLEQILKNLYLRSRTDYRERGVRILHITFGVLSWKENEAGSTERSPLILCPVELKRASSRDPLYPFGKLAECRRDLGI
jgi:hypothetical protein